MKVTGQITRQIDVENKKTAFAIYINSDGLEYPISWTNELALELAEILHGKLSTDKVFDLVEQYLGKVGRINSHFEAVRYHDDVKLTNSFINAFKNLMEHLQQLKVIQNFQLKPIKVNPSYYNNVSEGIVVDEVPVAKFRFDIK